MTRAEMIAKLRHWVADADKRILEPLDEGKYTWVKCPGLIALRDDMQTVAVALESEAEELRRVRDGIRQDAKAILIKSEQSGDCLGLDHVATRSLDYVACAMMTWAEDLSKLIGVEK